MTQNIVNNGPTLEEAHIPDGYADPENAGGGSHLESTVTVPITQSAWADIGDGVTSAHILEASTILLTLSDALNGELEYTGDRAIRAMVFGGISGTRVGSGTPQFELGLFHRFGAGSYVEVPGVSRQRDLTQRSGAFDTLPSAIVLEPGDHIKLMIKNNDSNDNAIITAAGLKLLTFAPH